MSLLENWEDLRPISFLGHEIWFSENRFLDGEIHYHHTEQNYNHPSFVIIPSKCISWREGDDLSLVSMFSSLISSDWSDGERFDDAIKDRTNFHQHSLGIFFISQWEIKVLPMQLEDLRTEWWTIDVHRRRKRGTTVWLELTKKQLEKNECVISHRQKTNDVVLRGEEWESISDFIYTSISPDFQFQSGVKYCFCFVDDPITRSIRNTQTVQFPVDDVRNHS